MLRENSPENGIIPTRFIPCRSKDSRLFKSESKFKKELKSESKAVNFSLTCKTKLSVGLWVSCANNCGVTEVIKEKLKLFSWYF